MEMNNPNHMFSVIVILEHLFTVSTNRQNSGNNPCRLKISSTPKINDCASQKILLYKSEKMLLNQIQNIERSMVLTCLTVSST